MAKDKQVKRIEKKLRDPDLGKKKRAKLQAELNRLEQEAAGERHLAHLARIKELAAIVVDPDAKTKARKAAQAELDSFKPEEIFDATEPVKTIKSIDGTVVRVSTNPDDVDRDDEEAVKAFNETTGKATGNYITSTAEKAKNDERIQAETDEEIKARVLAKRAERAGQTEEEAGKLGTVDRMKASATHSPDYVADLVKTEKKKRKAKPDEMVVEIDGETLAVPESALVQVAKAVKDTPENEALSKAVDAVLERAGEEALDDALADPEPVQPRDRWGRPIIVPPGATKGVGYRRTTTFIDVIDDKTALIDWGRRVVVTGVAAIEQKVNGEKEVIDIDEVGVTSVIERVQEANRELARAAKAADKALKKDKIDDDEHARLHDEAEKAHKAVLNDVVQEAYTAGDGFIKAETGTRLHKLSEFVDRGEPLPDDVTDSERRDLDAYKAALKKLNVEILAVEQFVVVDRLKVAGTLDRRIRYDSPALGRRITAIGDLKTGRVDFGAGKMTRQLAIYAEGKGYDWTRPEDRVTFRTNREYGLIFHLPAGSGVCTVYEIDLKKGAEGVKLCQAIYAHRDETKTKDVFTAVASSRTSDG
jgi:hypothetical protein